MVCYLDLIILENFCMNFLILYTTGKILVRKMKIRRLIIASIVGVVYMFSLYINVPMIILNVSKVIIALILVKISYNSKKIKNVINEGGVFFLNSFIYSGSALAFVHFFRPKVLYIVNGIIIGGEYIFEILFVSAIISFVLIKMSTKILNIKQKFCKQNMLCSLSIQNNGLNVVLKAFIDTGNLLTDPYSKKPIIIVEFEKIKHIFTNKTIEIFNYYWKGGEENEISSYDTNIKLIPYVSVGNNNGVLLVYKVDHALVEYNDKEYIVNDALIGLSREKLTNNNKYSALIGIETLERGSIKNESSANIKKESKHSIC